MRRRLLPLLALLLFLSSASAVAPRTETQAYGVEHDLAPYCGDASDTVPDVGSGSCFGVLAGETAASVRVEDLTGLAVPFVLHVYDAAGDPLVWDEHGCGAATLALPPGSATLEVWPSLGAIDAACGPRYSAGTLAVSTAGTIVATFT